MIEAKAGRPRAGSSWSVAFCNLGVSFEGWPPTVAKFLSPVASDLMLERWTLVLLLFI